jgi:RimJ/RimL family protein N-acetyltransferase
VAFLRRTDLPIGRSTDDAESGAHIQLRSRRGRGTLCRVKDEPRSADVTQPRLTTRLRLEAVGPANARDLWLVENDNDVAYWYGDHRPSLEESGRRAKFMGDSWYLHGVHKWIAYDRASGEVVGRGGLSRTPVDDDWGQLYALLPAEPWVRVAQDVQRPFVAHAQWLEIGWALRREYWGRGYASEIGRAGLAFAFEVLRVQAVVSCAVRHNARSRAVMQRIGMQYVGEIRSSGMVEGMEGERDGAPFAVCVVLRRDWNGSGTTASCRQIAAP